MMRSGTTQAKPDARPTTTGTNQKDVSPFKCIQFPSEIVEKLNARIANPALIDQKYTPLCGPAAFMYCLANEYPEVYRNYVMDLAIHGEARIGNLQVKPSQSCLQETADNLISLAIQPVDWIALASLRDSSNAVFPVTASSTLAGVTLPAALAGWFEATGLFSSGVNNTSVMNGKALNVLIEANSRHRNGAWVCLFVRSAIIGGGGSIGIDKIGGNTPKTWLGSPDHWIVLRSAMQLGRQCNLMPPSANCPRQNKLEDAALYFQFYSWGEVRTLSRARAAEFLPYFYGYVSAMNR